ncbi:RNAse R [Cyclonatronum proteinivorum]|uniref:Ribonuclease R n=1 Tax=Cyclonatronum proteinivorum TaxID=1457365 RepID=A0A345UKF9_9BACT|nr:ribonuclease R [Cyclonatronum proteinivorum]AXJ00961.1 RNAse R [Cyclonatronum proteinivorum]
MGKKKKVKELESFMLNFLRKNSSYEVPEELLLQTAQHTGGQVKALKRALNRLIDSGAVLRNAKGELSLAKGGAAQAAKSEGLAGRISVNRHGTGFVSLEGYEEDVRIPSKKLGVALDRDIVRIRLQGANRSGRTEGKVLDVVERGKKYYVGTLARENKHAWVIEPDEKSAHTTFFVQPENTGGGQSGDKVIFKLLDWVHPRSLPEAVVTEVLGAKGTNKAEVLSILAENDMISSFTPEVEAWCDQIPLFPGEDEIARRRDIRDMLVFTIDPEDAKDFDDALSISKLDNGNYYLGVHIADVTYYLHPKTVLDDAAHERATSVYLVDRVIPMLPEKLSNGVCSLRPNEDKMTYSCFMEVTPDGEVRDYQIEETATHSKFRLTYEEAQEIIEGKNHPELSGPMEMLVKLTDRLTEKRFQENAIDFESPEPRFVLDKTGKPVDVIIKKRFKAHRLIEECMLLANRTVAEHVDQLRQKSGKKITQDTFPFFYRIHAEPDTERLQQVADHVRPAGIKFDVRKGKVDAKSINNVLEQVKGKSIEYTVNDLLLRSMAKAEYSPKNIGHFGLGFSHYAHFTSPIRRYPDVLVHRLLKSYTAGLPSYNFKNLLTYGEHCSERERAAVTAERDSIKLKQVEYLSTRIGQEFDGVVSGVTERGIYVLLKDIYCEGMVGMSDLDDDFYIYDKRRHCLTGRRKGRTYMLGNELKVRVVNTNLELRQIDFELA